MKSNIRAKLANSGSGSRKKFFSKLNQQKIRKKAGHKVKDENLWLWAAADADAEIYLADTDAYVDADEYMVDR